MSADPHTALAEIVRRGAAIMVGERLVGGPRAVAFDLASVAAKALGVELRGEDAVRTALQPPEQQVQRRRTSR